MWALELKAPVTLKKVIEWRKYLESWRAVLGNLRHVGAEMRLKPGDPLLKDLPILQFLAELTRSECCYFVYPPAKTPPAWPIFTEKDQKTVVALQGLFCNSQSGRGCLAAHGMLKEQHRLLLVLKSLYTVAVAERVLSENEEEIRQFEQ